VIGGTAINTGTIPSKTIAKRSCIFLGITIKANSTTLRVNYRSEEQIPWPISLPRAHRSSKPRSMSFVARQLSRNGIGKL